MNTYKEKYLFEEPMHSYIGSRCYAYNATTTFVSYSERAYHSVRRSLVFNQIQAYFYLLKLDLVVEASTNKISRHHSLFFDLK